MRKTMRSTTETAKLSYDDDLNDKTSYYKNTKSYNRHKSSSSCDLNKYFIVKLSLLLILNISAVHSSYEEYRRPTYLEGRVGGFAVFNCHIDFPQEDEPIPYIMHWKKEGKVIFTWYEGTTQTDSAYTGRINLAAEKPGLGKASINLTAIRDSDNGWYECKIVFPNRTPSSRFNGTYFNLAIDGGTLLRVPPINATVMEYDPAYMNCSVKNPDSMFVEWFKDSKPLIDFHDLATRTTMGPDGSLMISPTLMTDLGEYKCVVKNLLGEKEEAKAYLNVQYKAKVVFAPEKIYLPFGKPALLDCHFRSNPPLLNLRWEKDGFLYDPYNVQGVFYKENGSLYFNHVDDNHAGKYSCTPYNELGTAGPSPSINVIVQHPPKFTLKPSTIYVQKLGETVHMHCSATSRDSDDDRAMIAWSRKDGTALPLQRHFVEGGNLTIENIVAEDRGVYTCKATNEAASITMDTELLIETVSPKSPSNLNANSSQTAITLRWTSNIIRPDLRYFVWYRLSDVQEWRTQQVYPPDVHETTIENLEPGKEYEMMVLCQDRYQDGMFSKTFRYMTKPKDYQEPEELKDTLRAFQQIGPPRNVTVEFVDEDYLISWDPPDYGHDLLTVYVIRWYLEPDHELVGTQETRNNYHKITNLDNDRLYSVAVASISTNGYEALGEEQEILTPSFRTMQAFIVFSTVALLILLAIVGITLYVKRHLFSSSSSYQEEKI